MLNPDLSIKVQGEWKKIYEWLPLDENIVFFEPDYVDRGEVIDIDQLKTAAWTPHIEHLWKVREARYQQEQLDARRMFLHEMMDTKAEYEEVLKQRLEQEQKLKFQLEQEKENLKNKLMNELARGVWTDLKTGLMWMRCSMGQTWDGVTAQGDAEKYSWDGAKKAIANMNKEGGFAGYSDWRLPDIDALKTIRLEGQAGYKCPQGVLFKPCRNDYGFYWSASPLAGGNNDAWVVLFGDGATSYDYKGSNFYVRAVRAGQ
jgi:hypothetical protein